MKPPQPRFRFRFDGQYCVSDSATQIHGKNPKRFYEKVVKVKADVAAILKFFS